MKIKNILRILALTLVVTALGLGCRKKLAPGGAYSPVVTNVTTGAAVAMPDMAFYTVDASFMLAYSVVDTVFSIERDNRETFWKLSPAIKHTLDQARPTATLIVTDYFKARAAYIANPTQPGLVGLQEYLARIQQISIALKAVLPSGTNTVTLTP